MVPGPPVPHQCVAESPAGVAFGPGDQDESKLSLASETAPHCHARNDIVLEDIISVEKGNNVEGQDKCIQQI